MTRYPTATNPQVLQHSIDLAVSVNSVPMTVACRERYALAIAAELQDMSRLINLLICNGSMCPYVTGAPGTGVPVNQSAVINSYHVFVAIDTVALTNPVMFDVVASTVYCELFNHHYVTFICSGVICGEGIGVVAPRRATEAYVGQAQSKVLSARRVMCRSLFAIKVL